MLQEVKKIFEIETLTLFYIAFVCLVLTIINVNIVYSNIVIFLICLIFIVRILKRRSKINVLSYFDLNETKYENDSLKRANQLIDVLMIIIFIFLFLELNININYSSGSSFLYSAVFNVPIFLLLASKSIAKNNKFLKVMTILSSTFYVVFVILLTILILIVKIYEFLLNYNDLPQDFFDIFRVEHILAISYVVENHFLQNIFLVFLSIGLHLLFILTTPPYQLNNLEEALKISNVIILISSVVVFFLANIYWAEISETIQESIISGYQGLDQEEKFLFDYIKLFSVTNLINVGYILLLPYVLSISIATLTIDFLKRKYNKKANEALESIIELRFNKSTDELDIFKKRYLYYGGERYNLRLLEYIEVSKGE